jgi:hypothetical protein
VKCLAKGARIEERGVHHLPRVAGEQSGANPRVVARAFRELAKLWRSLHHPYPALPDDGALIERDAALRTAS